MPRKPPHRQLREARILRRLSERDLDRMCDLAEEGSCARGETLFRQGEPIRGLYFLLSGAVKLGQIGVDGKEMVMRVVGPGEAFAVVAAFDRARSFPVTASALTDSEVLLWRAATARELTREIPALASALSEEISRQAQSFQERLREVATESVPRRLAHMLVRLAETSGRVEEAGTLIDFPLTRQDLAGMIGSTLFTVSRLLSEWAEKGFVRTGRARVVVCSVDALLSEVEGSKQARRTVTG